MRCRLTNGAGTTLSLSNTVAVVSTLNSIDDSSRLLTVCLQTTSPVKNVAPVSWVYHFAIIQLENATMCLRSLLKCKFFYNSCPSFVTRRSLWSLGAFLTYSGIVCNSFCWLLRIIPCLRQHRQHRCLSIHVVAICDCVNLLFISQ